MNRFSPGKTRGQEIVVTPQSESPFVPITGESGTARIKGISVPYRIRRPANRQHIKDSVPVVVSTGLGASAGEYTRFTQYLAGLGHIVMLHEAPRYHGMSALHPAHVRDPLKVRGMTRWAVMKDFAEQYGVTKFDQVGHSTDGAVSIDNARRHPESIRNTLLLGSVGVTGHNTLQMAGRAVCFLAREFTPALLENPPLGLNVAFHVGRNPVRFAREAVEVSNCDRRGDIAALQADGSKIAQLWMSDDTFFPDPQASNGSHYVEGGHLAIQRQPERIARVVDYILDQM